MKQTKLERQANALLYGKRRKDKQRRKRKQVKTNPRVYTLNRELEEGYQRNMGAEVKLFIKPERKPKVKRRKRVIVAAHTVEEFLAANPDKLKRFDGLF